MVTIPKKSIAYVDIKEDLYQLGCMEAFRSDGELNEDDSCLQAAYETVQQAWPSILNSDELGETAFSVFDIAYTLRQYGAVKFWNGLPAEADLLLGKYYFSKGADEKMRSHFNSYLENHPNASYVHAMFGHMLLSRGYASEAREHLEAALNGPDSNIDRRIVEYDLVNTYFILDDQDAIEDIEGDVDKGTLSWVRDLFINYYHNEIGRTKAHGDFARAFLVSQKLLKLYDYEPEKHSHEVERLLNILLNLGGGLKLTDDDVKNMSVYRKRLAKTRRSK